MTDQMVPITFCLTVGVVIALNYFFRYRTRQSIQATIRAAIEQGQQLTPEVLEGFTDSLNPRAADLRRGVISLFLGLGILLFGQLLGEEDARGPLMAISVFPTLIGIAYMGLWFFLRKKP